MTRRRVVPAALIAVLALGACGSPQGTAPGEEATFAPEAEIPQLEGVAAGGADEGAAQGLGEETVEVEEATPPGLHIANFTVSPLSPALRDAINFTGFKSGGPGGLIELPVYGLNPRQKIYYLIAPVINEGPRRCATSRPAPSSSTPRAAACGPRPGPSRTCRPAWPSTRPACRTRPSPRSRCPTR